MTATFALAAFLARWAPGIRHDLAASECEPLALADLLARADHEDRARWERLDLGYPDPWGAPWLRAALAARHATLSGDDLVCCSGAQEALSCTVASLVQPGDHAVVVLPIYQPAEQAVTSLCATTGVPLREEAGAWHLDADRIAAALRPETRLVLMNLPNSPTGAQLDSDGLEALVRLCRARGIWLVNDEVYGLTATAGAPPVVADLYERGVSVNGLSKGFGLPGLRVGWAASRDRDLLARIVVAKSRSSSCLSATSEVLAHVALKSEATIRGRNRAIGTQNASRLQQIAACCPGLLEMGPAQNLAFAFVRYRGANSSEAFARELAGKAGILVLPGSLWRSPLAPVAEDGLRIGLGRRTSEGALGALAAHLSRRAAAPAA
ncbi:MULTISPECIES: pyridoxal phosphate-dependent aminotransferase [Methylobacterium]|uniref:Aminotransferase n=2 Tax=Methylobacterium TaxID=407 RepID=A0A0C6FLB9_9HYPH|nr:pyridoxal phosphate-dependent aminotransferase [Methylobacterium aquaticum]QRE77229.1 pyridoxal phosphate-dependent aminotransferase [Methylobacterium aquaticum]BAQ45964.1 aminotransferase class I/II [Methylobacterium aquaticum]